MALPTTAIKPIASNAATGAWVISWRQRVLFLLLVDMPGQWRGLLPELKCLALPAPLLVGPLDAPPRTTLWENLMELLAA